MIRATIDYFIAWNFVRWIRFILGGSLLFQSFSNKDSVSGILGAFLLFQALSNTGCCGSGNCSVPMTRTDSKSEEIIEYTEIREKRVESRE